MGHVCVTSQSFPGIPYPIFEKPVLETPLTIVQCGFITMGTSFNQSMHLSSPYSEHIYTIFPLTSYVLFGSQDFHILLYLYITYTHEVHK